jgi:hypothetical protein
LKNCCDCIIQRYSFVENFKTPHWLFSKLWINIICDFDRIALLPFPCNYLNCGLLGFQQFWENQINHLFKISTRCNFLSYEMLYVKIEPLLLVEFLYTNIPPETMEPHGTLIPTTAIFPILQYVRRTKCFHCYNFLYIIYIKYDWYCVKISGQKSQNYLFYEWKIQI